MGSLAIWLYMYMMIFNHPIFYEPKDVFYTSIWNPYYWKLMEQCQICDLQRRFNFGTRDQGWSLKSFFIVEFY